MPLPVRAEVLKPRHPVKPEVTRIRRPVVALRISCLIVPAQTSLRQQVPQLHTRACHVSRRRRTSGMPGHWHNARGTAIARHSFTAYKSYTALQNAPKLILDCYMLHCMCWVGRCHETSRQHSQSPGACIGARANTACCFPEGRLVRDVSSCVCVCMYVIYIYICVCVYIYHIYIYINTYIHTYIHSYTHMTAPRRPICTYSQTPATVFP